MDHELERQFDEIMNEIVPVANEVEAYLDADGQRREFVTCDFVNFILPRLRAGAVSRLLLIALTGGDDKTADIAGQVDHVVAHKLIELGMAIQALRDSGRIPWPFPSEPEAVKLDSESFDDLDALFSALEDLAKEELDDDE